MLKTIIEGCIHLLLVLPLILFTLKSKDNLKTLCVFALFFLANKILLVLPIEYNTINLFNGKWNWTGKILSILGSIVFILMYKKYTLEDYFLTLKQNKKFLKKGILTLLILLFIQTIMNTIYNTHADWDTETILFQMTMPGIGEEIAYRGIMLGLLCKILKPIKGVFNPAIWITSLLFGFAHGLSLNNSYTLNFHAFSFFNTLIMGLIFAWLTINSGSILLALISHNLGNLSSKLISMCK